LSTEDWEYHNEGVSGSAAEVIAIGSIVFGVELLSENLSPLVDSFLDLLVHPCKQLPRRNGKERFTGKGSLEIGLASVTTTTMLQE